MSNKNRSSFWIVTAPGIRSTLVYADASGESTETALEMSIFDCDGAVSNQAKIEFATQRQCAFELGPLLGNLKRQAGFAHGLVTISGLADLSRLLVRFQTPQLSFFLPIHQGTHRNRSQAMAVNLAESRRGLLVIANTEDVEITVRGRLLVGRRSPECTWTFPPHSSRMVDLASTFAEIIGEEESSMFGRGYLRLSTSAEQGIVTHIMVLNRPEDSALAEAVFIY